MSGFAVCMKYGTSFHRYRMALVRQRVHHSVERYYEDKTDRIVLVIGPSATDARRILRDMLKGRKVLRSDILWASSEVK